MMIEIKNLSKSFKNHQVLKDISFSLPCKGFFLLLGDNGCGKSTLLYILSMIDHSYSGQYLFDGVESKSIPIKKRSAFCSKNIGLVFSKDNLFSDLSIEENRSFMVTGKIENLDSLSNDQQVRNLSGGKEILLALSNEISRNQKLLLLDEVTSFIDDLHLKEVIRILKQESLNRLIILATHDKRVINDNSLNRLTILNGTIDVFH
jgi:ABC-type lipoprotein export system ATPase subunit